MDSPLNFEININILHYQGMTPDVQNQLIEDHFLFKEGDRFLQAANASRFWPTGRGIFHNKNKTFLVWVGEEDHLRIISMQQGSYYYQIDQQHYSIKVDMLERSTQD